MQNTPSPSSQPEDAVHLAAVGLVCVGVEKGALRSPGDGGGHAEQRRGRQNIPVGGVLERSNEERIHSRA